MEFWAFGLGFGEAVGDWLEAGVVFGWQKGAAVLWGCGNWEGILCLFSFCFSVIVVFLGAWMEEAKGGNEGMLGCFVLLLFLSFF